MNALRLVSTGTRLPRLAVAIAVMALALLAAAKVGAAESRAAELHAGAGGALQLEDDDRGESMFSLRSVAPGEPSTRCIALTYRGPSPARVRLFARVSGRLARYLSLTVTRGTDRSPSFPSCDSFSADRVDYIGAGAGVIYAGRLSDYPHSEAAGLLDPAAGPEQRWRNGERHSYRFSVSLVDDNAAQGLTGRWAFRWQAGAR